MMVCVWLRRDSRSFCAASYLNLPKSMSLHTGGFAIGATSTRSRSASTANRNASSMRTMPTCSPAGPTKRTSGTRIRSLIRGSTLMAPPCSCGYLVIQLEGLPSNRRKDSQHERTHPTGHICATDPWHLNAMHRWEPRLLLRDPGRRPKSIEYKSSSHE